ncbi:hypothetical protein [Nitrosomonas halophila]|uniref:Uncharacterized protein n=1 Tax=Nitrosomonas halophila TaxID=44576 RepID=A0A1H3H2W9_9PROT|nr:hypothetical protein [Nitrosomonas halophila]SDY09727.1 hypothetical protein SAMN05421881_10184 [Nitrosomonas halophila]
MTDHLSQIRDLFGGEEGWEVGDFIHSFADPKQAILAWSVFFPEFEVVNGQVVLGPLLPEQRSQLEESQGSRESAGIVNSFRWREVPYLFSVRDSTNRRHDHHLAELMAMSWLLKLQMEFPGESWKTRVFSEEETGGVVGVGFENT